MFPTIHSISIRNIDGSPLVWEKFDGKKILIVNVASECGFTPQYGQLQELYDNYNDRLEIIGVPCNDFGGQEPGSHDEIVQFCTRNYGVSFAITEKVGIINQPHPLYTWLMNTDVHGNKTSSVLWNFHKYLINEDGQLIANFTSDISPLDEKIISAL